MSITNQNFLTQSLIPKDNSVTIGSANNPIKSITTKLITVEDLYVTNHFTVYDSDIKDPIINLSFGSENDLLNTGIMSSYYTAANRWTGLIRYYNDSKYYLFKDAISIPTINSDISALTKADLVLGNLNSSGININSLTASKLIISDVSKNLISSTINDTDITTLNTDQTITGIKTFSSAINNTTLTASKLLLSNGSKNIISSIYNDSDLVLTSTNQTISGIKTFSNTINNTTLTASKNLLTDSSKNIISSLYAESEFCRLTNTSDQTFNGNIRVISQNNEAHQWFVGRSSLGNLGYMFYTPNDADGFKFYNIATSLNLKEPLLQLVNYYKQTLMDLQNRLQNLLMILLI